MFLLKVVFHFLLKLKTKEIIKLNQELFPLSNFETQLQKVEEERIEIFQAQLALYSFGISAEGKKELKNKLYFEMADFLIASIGNKRFRADYRVDFYDPSIPMLDYVKVLLFYVPKKLKINKSRRWKYNRETGTYRHFK